MASESEYILGFLLVLSLLLLLQYPAQARPRIEETNIKTEVFRSPKFVSEPGLVVRKFYYGIDFPKGHIGIKSFDAEVVDEDENPIPLHEVYLHHWLVFRYYQRKGVSGINDTHHHSANLGVFDSSDLFFVKNSGVCEFGLTQYFGLGAETRKTPTDIPDPYGLEVGNEVNVPEGFEERWMLNVHTIDTRGAEDRMGCTECRCDLYNVESKALPENYKGGLKCCVDESRCRVRTGFHGPKRNLYLRYKVTYVDWTDSIVPVKIYVLDVTDTWTKGDDESRGIKTRHPCQIEYDAESCPNANSDEDRFCMHTRTLKLSSPINGDVIYAVGHQHTGGVGITLYGQGGREICASLPRYGEGSEAGNEAGYIVGMSTCYPLPGSIKIAYGETLTLASHYNSTQEHVGVMGLFYLLVADDATSGSYSNPIANHEGDFPVHERVMKLKLNEAAIGLFALAVVVCVIVMLRSGERGYEPVL